MTINKGNLNLILLVKKMLQNILMTYKTLQNILIEHNIAFIGYFSLLVLQIKLILSIYQQNYN
jgi:hypothetical protein